MKKILLIITIMFIFLTGCAEKEIDIEKYENMEKELETGAIKYSINLNITDTEKIQSETLLYNGYINDTVLMENDGTYCAGYVLLMKKENNVCAEAYVQCKDYTTSDYGTLEMKKECK